MRNRISGSFPLVAAAALLLSGSAFAECPRFLAGNPLPTVIVTDNTLAGTPDSPANVFVYSNAFDLINYIDVGSTTSNPAQDARWNFAEFLNAGSSTPQGVASQLYTINGNDGLAAAPTTAAGLNATSFSAATGGQLTFRNKFLSPPPTPGGGYAAPASGDLDAGSQRTIRIYLVAPTASTACALDANVVNSAFTVITSETGPDRLTGPLCSWTPFFATGGSFDTQWGTGALPPTAGAYSQSVTPAAALGAGFDIFPNSAPAGTTAIAMSATAGTNDGLSLWGRKSAALTSERIYRVRANVGTNLTISGSSTWIRHRLGGSFYYETGNAEQGFDVDSVSLPTVATGAQTMTMYAWIKNSTPGSGPASLTGVDSPYYFFDLIGRNRPAMTVTISNVTIDSTTRDCLGAGTVLKNYGVASVSNNDGFTPPASPTAFASGDGWINAKFDITTPNTTTFSTAFGASGAVSTFTTTLNTNDQQGWGAFGSLTTAVNRFTVNTSKLYALDAWVSAPAVQNNTTQRAPVMRLRMVTEEGQNNHRDQYIWQVHLASDGTFGQSAAEPNNAGLTTAGSAKHYVGFYFPNLNTNTVTGGQTNTAYQYFVDFLWNRAANLRVQPNGTVTVERVTLTEYDKPTF